jgi:hypothetical protein
VVIDSGGEAKSSANLSLAHPDINAIMANRMDILKKLSS